MGGVGRIRAFALLLTMQLKGVIQCLLEVIAKLHSA
jgi:hypothetical protein